MLNRPRFQTAVKALVLLALAVFLYTRLADGTLFFYINQRFMVYTILAVVGLVLVAISYRTALRRTNEVHNHGDHGEEEHSHHSLTWAGLALVVLPMVLGILIPPQPLGAAALENREINVTTQPRNVLPAAVRAAAQKNAADRNLLDWLNAFTASSDPVQEYTGQPVDVIGFVYHDERLADDEVLISRFIVSCCVADANVAGMIVRWPGAAELAADQWVEVSGMLEPGQFDGQKVPTLAAQSVTPVEVPQQPYLYP